MLACVTTVSAAPIIHWTFDEAAGNVAHDSAPAGGAQDGTNGVPSAQWQPGGGIIGGAVRFSPTSETDVDEAFLFAGSSDVVPGFPFTIAAWVKTTSDPGYQEGIASLANTGTGANASYGYLAKTGPSSFPSDTNNRGAIGLVSPGKGHFSNPAAPPLNNGTWHHLVGVFPSGGTSLDLYVDGLKRTVNDSGPPTIPSFGASRFSIGAVMTGIGATEAFTGLIDDAGVWDEGLTSRRVALMYELGIYSHVASDDPGIDLVDAVFTSQSGAVRVGDYVWQYATGLPQHFQGQSGMIGNDPYIVLSETNFDAPGTGVRGTLVPEPAGAAALYAAALLVVSRRGTRGRRRSGCALSIATGTVRRFPLDRSSPSPCRAPVEALEGRVLMATHSWTGAGATDNWSDVANWAEGAAPSATEAQPTVVFNSADPLSVDDIPSLQLGELRFDAGSNVTLRLDVELGMAKAGNDRPAVIAAAAQQNSITGQAGLTFFNLNAAGFNVAAGGTLDVGVAVGGGVDRGGTRGNIGTLEKLGPGTLRLSGFASNNLGVAVSEGMLVLQKTGGATAVRDLYVRHSAIAPSVAVLGADEQIDDRGLVDLQGAGSTFDLNGHTETVSFNSSSGLYGPGSVIDLSDPNSHLVTVGGTVSQFNGTVVGTGTFTVATGFWGFGVPMKNEVTFEIQNASVFFYGPQDLKAVNVADAGSVTFNFENSKAYFGDTPVTRLRSLSLTGGAVGRIYAGGLILDYQAGQSPLATVRAASVSGYAGGAFNGPGLKEYGVSGSLGYVGGFVGYAENDPAAGGLGLGQFLGQDVDPTSVLIRLTLPGDADLDGTVGAADFNRFASHFGQVDRAWTDGDFNYDGAAGPADFNLLATYFGQSLFPPSSATPSAVSASAVTARVAAQTLDAATKPSKPRLAYKPVTTSGALPRRAAR